MSTHDFVHLHVHTQFSLLDGACRLKELFNQVNAYGMKACAMTDHGNMFGAVDFYKEAKSSGVKPIIGAEVYISPGSRFDKTSHGVKGAGYHLVLLAKNLIGYKNLMEIVSLGYLEGFYYKPRVDKEVLARCSKGLIALSACLKGEVSQYLLSGLDDKAIKAANEYTDIFGKGNYYLEMQDNKIKEQYTLNKKLIELSKDLSMPLVATNDVHYLRRDDNRAHEMLLCIQTQSTLEDTDRMKFSTDQLYFKSPEEMYESFKDVPEALKNTVKIAEECNVEMDFTKIHLPKFTPPEGKDNTEFFQTLIDEGINKRYPVVTTEIKERVKHEFSIIEKLGYISYFLIVWDFINKARELDIPVGPGRGSAAGSIISYAIGITNIDPMKYGLIFERFLNPARVTMPDIDIDFCYERRGEIIDYVIEKYSKENVAQIITFGTMKAKAALRDVGRVMGIQYADVDKIAKLVPMDIGITLAEALEKVPELKAIYDSDKQIADLVDVAKRLEGLNRHASVHAAGVVISDMPLIKRIPLYKSSDGQITTGFTMNALTDIGMLKMDFLGLKTLTVIDFTLKIIKRTRKQNIKIEDIPEEDPLTFEMFCKGATSGIFQLESSGMKDLLRKLKPSRFEDIIAILALYRPGPLGSGMVEEFIKRKNGEIEVKYDHPILEPTLKETYGIIIYQEQVMKIVSDLAGFSLAEADNVRKVMSKKKPEAMAKLRVKFFEGTDEKNIKREAAEKIFDQIEYFAGYGFNKSHSAGYAVISYQTAYLKANYTVEYIAALLTSERNDTNKIADYIGEGARMGIATLPPDINESYRNFTVVDNGIRFGLVAIKNVGEAAVEHIIEVRHKQGKFTSFFDFAQKVDLRSVNRKVFESLIKCGAFDSLGIHRSQAMAVLDQVLGLAQKIQKDRQGGQLSFFDEGQAIGDFNGNFQDVPDIPEWNEHELLASEKDMLGFYISRHPLSKYEKLLNAYSTSSLSNLVNLNDGQRVLVGGLISRVRITVTRKNSEKMAIIRLEDLNNFTEVLVFPRTYQKCSEFVAEDMLVFIDGKLNLKEESPKIFAEDIILLEKVKEFYTKSVVLKLTTTGLSESLMKDIKTKISQHKGNVPIFVDLIAPEGRRVRLSMEGDMAVTPDDSLIDALEDLIGTGNVKFLTK
ncbi:MAG: DNA polymerase III subunit alpha [Candidatus Omnitrophica bacterium]|nr:DNA polymerase III subunit alpha [Candidatus Omnitrophota bacterium]